MRPRRARAGQLPARARLRCGATPRPTRARAYAATRRALPRCAPGRRRGPLRARRPRAANAHARLVHSPGSPVALGMVRGVWRGWAIRPPLMRAARCWSLRAPTGCRGLFARPLLRPSPRGSRPPLTTTPPAARSCARNGGRPPAASPRRLEAAAAHRAAGLRRARPGGLGLPRLPPPAC